MLATAMTANDQAFDLNGDGIVDIADRKFWIEELANSYFGDRASTIRSRFNRYESTCS